MGNPPSSHRLALLLSALIAAGILSFAAVSLPHGGTAAVRADEIAVEHAKPLLLSMVVSTGSALTIIEVSHDSKESIRFSTPTSWKLREVLKGRLKDLAEAPPSFGFVQRTIPPGSTLSFLLPSPGGLLLHNPSNTSLEVRLKTINLVTNATSTEVFLMKEGPKRLW